MKENIKGQIKKELTWIFWVVFFGAILLYIIILAAIYCYSGFCFGFNNIVLSATNNYLMALTAGLTLIIASVSVWVFYRTLKTQQTEIQQSQLRFEIQQFEETLFQMLDRLLKTRDQINLTVELYSNKYVCYQQTKYFDYTIYILRYLQLALKGEKIFNLNDWSQYEFLNLKTEESVDDLYLREKEPEEYEKKQQTEIKDERILFASYKFELKKEDWDNSDKSELWYCKYAFKKVFSKYHVHHETYFRNLENILEFIELKYSVLNQKDNELLGHYSKIISSNMSQNELSTLFYYAVVFDKFQKLCVKLNFFERLDSNYLLDKCHAELISGIKISNTQEHYDAQKSTTV